MWSFFLSFSRIVFLITFLDVVPLQERPEPGRTNIYQSVVINSSKEMMAFSDFPPPAELPNHMHHSEVLLYMRLYAQAFQLLPHIRFQVSVSQADDPIRQCSYSWKIVNYVFSDHSGECEANIGFRFDGSVGGGDREQWGSEGDSCFRRSHTLYRTLYQTTSAARWFPRYQQANNT